MIRLARLILCRVGFHRTLDLLTAPEGKEFDLCADCCTVWLDGKELELREFMRTEGYGR